MFKMKLSQRIFLPTLTLIILTFALLYVLIQFSLKGNLLEMVRDNMSTELETASYILEVSRSAAQKKVNSDLKTFHHLFYNWGELKEIDSTISMEAVNQITKATKTVQLKQWMIGDLQIQNNFEIVDQIQALAGGTATIFQKIDDGFLRVSTNVKKLDGNRAVGTYIPNSSPVIQTILRGETFRGRAFVVNDWYLTAYEPLLIDGKIKGILYVGVQEKALEEIRNALGSITIKESGVYGAVGLDGVVVIHPSMEGQDMSGEPFMQEMLQKREGFLEYEENGKEMIAVYQYYAPFEWIITAAAPLEEFLDEIMWNLNTSIVLSFVLSIILLSIALFLIARSIIKSLQKIEVVTEEVTQAAAQLSSRSQTQRTSVENISASLRELIASIQDVAENTNMVSNVANNSAEQAKTGNEAVQQATQAMSLIRESSEQITEIIQVISDITEQTNLLALNAAIEAARAGEEGKGFAVVADEVRKLAERSATAAKEVTTLIKESEQRVAEGSELSNRASEVLNNIMGHVDKTAEMVEQISAATEEQAATSHSIKDGMEEISTTIEENTAFAEAQANSAQNMMEQIQAIIHGKEMPSTSPSTNPNSNPPPPSTQELVIAEAPKSIPAITSKPMGNSSQKDDYLDW